MKKVLATVLAMAMILSLGVTVFAAQRYDVDDADVSKEVKSIDNDGGTADTTFKVVDKSDTVPTYQMSVTVPLTVTFAVAKDGTTSVPSNYKLTNYSFQDVKVSKIQATNDEWTLETEANAKAAAEGSKTVNMNIKGLDLSTTTTGIEPTSWETVVKAADLDGTELDLLLTAVAAPQKGDPDAKNTSDSAFKVTYTIAMLPVEQPAP